MTEKMTISRGMVLGEMEIQQGRDDQRDEGCV